MGSICIACSLVLSAAGSTHAVTNETEGAQTVIIALPALPENADHYRLQIVKESADAEIPPEMTACYTTTAEFPLAISPEWTRYAVSVRQVDRHGIASPESTPLVFSYDEAVRHIGKAASQPGSFALFQNAPNPFNPETAITFNLMRDGQVRLAVYNVAGQEVCILENRYLSAGSHTFVWNASNMPSGAYFYTLTAPGFSDTKKMMLLK
jgi:hypothetical protein